MFPQSSHVVGYSFWNGVTMFAFTHHADVCAFGTFALYDLRLATQCRATDVAEHAFSFLRCVGRLGVRPQRPLPRRILPISHVDPRQAPDSDNTSSFLPDDCK